jgi:hypothetical protein
VKAYTNVHKALLGMSGSMIVSLAAQIALTAKSAIRFT